MVTTILVCKLVSVVAMGMANALAGEGPGYNYSIVLMISCHVFGYFHCIFSAIISVPNRCWNFDTFVFDFWLVDKGFTVFDVGD